MEFTFGGIAPDKLKFTYKVKVNTDKPILEVHAAIKEMDANSKVLFEGDLVWKNIVHSIAQPIEQGKTYEDDRMLSPGVVKVECSFKEVIFKDNTRWSASDSAPVAPKLAPATKPSETNPRTPSSQTLARAVLSRLGTTSCSRVSSLPGRARSK